MCVVTYTATRSIISGHTENSSYELELCLVAADPTLVANRTENKSLSQLRETLYWGSRDGYNITIGYYQEVSAANDAALEFLKSVLGGESFTFDMWGSPGSADNPLTAIMTSPYSIFRAVRKPSQKADLLSYSFPIEVLP